METLFIDLYLTFVTFLIGGFIVGILIKSCVAIPENWYIKIYLPAKQFEGKINPIYKVCKRHVTQSSLIKFYVDKYEFKWIEGHINWWWPVIIYKPAYVSNESADIGDLYEFEQLNNELLSKSMSIADWAEQIISEKIKKDDEEKNKKAKLQEKLDFHNKQFNENYIGNDSIIK